MNYVHDRPDDVVNHYEYSVYLEDFPIEVCDNCGEYYPQTMVIKIIDEEAFKNFLNVLDRPVQKKLALQKLLMQKAPWE